MKSQYLLKLAYSCWGIALGFATVNLLGYWISRSNLFISGGMAALIVGFSLTCTGLILISIFRFQNRNIDQDLSKKIKKSIFLPRVLLFLNFPLVIAFIFIGDHLYSNIYLHIINESSQAINQIVISSSRNKTELGSLTTSASIKTYFSPKSEGEVLISVWTDKAQKTTTITGYASGLGGSSDDSKVVIKDNLQIIIFKLEN